MTVEVALGPGSSTWERLGQWRFLLVMHRALVLQSAHPAVGAAVAEFSVYNARPWRRLFRTIESLHTYVYGSASEQRRELARLERLHRRMQGQDGYGRAFDAGDTRARAWVHLTLFEAVLTMQRLGGDPLSAEETARFYDEWRRVGRQFGLHEEDLPATPGEFQTYFDRVVAEVLEDNATVRDLLSGSVYRVPPPPGLPIPELLWAPVRFALVTAAVQATAATLPPVYRERLRLPLVPGADLVVHGLHLAVRMVTDLLPKPWRYQPIAAASIRAAGMRRAEVVPESFFETVLDQSGDGVLRWSDLLAMAREISTHLDLDEKDEDAVHDAFHSWWEQLATATGTPVDGSVTAAAYNAALADGTYPGPPDRERGCGAVAATVRGLIDRDGNGEVRQDEYTRLLDHSPRRHELIAAMRELDHDGDGTIHGDELEQALREFLVGERDFEAARHLLGRI
ncbi:oxygenase MpaB family protein [Lentzea sp. DG1S-22]|uniref:oxygenase MpaB family protein n=1 Tax=Lentzea sp. DG1S-22 TaxID=3108822 RepID=UPI002E76677D|nr:oxygenase MpaB family protein [Lentzea sp. DG1S-22]WVH83048.1 oxygenase MpaB family protein [Lentzea sp. DG1S-22]